MPENNWYVEIVETKSNAVIKEMGPMPKRKAEKTMAGVEINLNHEEFFVRVVERAG